MKKMIFIVLIFNTYISIAQENIENNIKTYCKVWGICKYYSNAKNINWDTIFFNQFDSILAAKNDVELNVVLTGLIENNKLKKSTILEIGSDFSLNDFHKLNKNREYILKSDFDWIFNSTNISLQNRHLLIEILKEFTGKKPKTVSVNDKVIEHDKEVFYDRFSNKIALLALLRFYNVIEYYYPYKHLLDTDWDSVLTIMTPAFIECQNIQQYKNALNHFASFLQDSHVDIEFRKIDSIINDSKKDYRKQYPIKFGYIEDKLYVSNVLNDSITNHYKLKSGDVITRVNQQGIPSIMHEAEQYYSVSRKENAHFALFDYLRKLDSLEITIQNRNIALNKVEMTKAQFIDLYRYGRLSNTFERNNIKLDETVGYVYLPTSKYSTIDNVFRRFKQKKTIILDCRGYGTMATLKLPKLLSNHKKDVARSYLPTKKYPGVFEKGKNESYYVSNTIDLIGKFLFGYKKKIFPTFNTPYKGKVVVLIDDHAISYGETVTMIIKVYAPEAIFIGRPTAGANGNVSTLTLPLGSILDYSAVDFQFADGTDVQRRGIQPDIYVPRTIEADITGKDEILNAALEYIRIGAEE